MNFGQYGLKTLDAGWITNRQIEAARIAMTRKIKRGGKVWINVFPHKPITKKPLETRMGKGKGEPEYWVAIVKPGTVMFEITGVDETTAKKCLARVAHKLVYYFIATGPFLLVFYLCRDYFPGWPEPPIIAAWVLARTGLLEECDLRLELAAARRVVDHVMRDLTPRLRDIVRRETRPAPAEEPLEVPIRELTSEADLEHLVGRPASRKPGEREEQERESSAGDQGGAAAGQRSWSRWSG